MAEWGDVGDDPDEDGDDYYEIRGRSRSYLKDDDEDDDEDKEEEEEDDDDDAGLEDDDDEEEGANDDDEGLQDGGDDDEEDDDDEGLQPAFGVGDLDDSDNDDSDAEGGTGGNPERKKRAGREWVSFRMIRTNKEGTDEDKEVISGNLKICRRTKHPSPRDTPPSVCPPLTGGTAWVCDCPQRP